MDRRLYEAVSKHGNHDQRTHGPRRAPTRTVPSRSKGPRERDGKKGMQQKLGLSAVVAGLGGGAMTALNRTTLNKQGVADLPDAKFVKPAVLLRTHVDTGSSTAKFQEAFAEKFRHVPDNSVFKLRDVAWLEGKTQEETLSRVERAIANESSEHMVVVNKKGRIEMFTRGTPAMAVTDREWTKTIMNADNTMVDLQKVDGMVMTHNHPRVKSSLLSPPDIMAAQQTGVPIRAVTASGEFMEYNPQLDSGEFFQGNTLVGGSYDYTPTHIITGGNIEDVSYTNAKLHPTLWGGYETTNSTLIMKTSEQFPELGDQIVATLSPERQKALDQFRDMQMGILPDGVDPKNTKQIDKIVSVGQGAMMEVESAAAKYIGDRVGFDKLNKAMTKDRNTTMKLFDELHDMWGRMTPDNIETLNDYHAAPVDVDLGKRAFKFGKVKGYGKSLWKAAT